MSGQNWTQVTKKQVPHPGEGEEEQIEIYPLHVILSWLKEGV